jgi:hypothetical protein
LRLQAFCKHQPSWRCRHLPDQHTALEQLWLLEPDRRHGAARIDHFAQLYKPEVTGSIPVRFTRLVGAQTVGAAVSATVGSSTERVPFAQEKRRSLGRRPCADDVSGAQVDDALVVPAVACDICAAVSYVVDPDVVAGEEVSWRLLPASSTKPLPIRCA